MKNYYSIYKNEKLSLIMQNKGEKLFRLYTDDNTKPVLAEENDDLPVFKTAKKWLDMYFEGKEPDVYVDIYLEHKSPYAKQVLLETQKIPFGSTKSYAEISKILNEKGIKSAPRSVGGALNKNDVLIIIPCHRVIGKNGGLVGFGGGLDLKERLLRHESGNK